VFECTGTGAQPLALARLAVPGMMQRTEKSALLSFVSWPSGKRDSPTFAVVLSPAAVVPVPSVQGAAVLPSWHSASS
jgi:hypothetical protein